ncbi:unnamed protein product [Closterium sp. Yama58-4]|nr:unnamed protein product [Closterium sp. Yama58-4]
MRPHNLAEVGQDAAEHTGPMDPRHPLPRSQPPQAADYQDAQETPLGCEARKQQGERQVLLDARLEMMTSNGGVLALHHPASGGHAPSWSAPDAPIRHGHSRPTGHGAHDHLHSSAQAMDGKTGRVGTGGQEIVPHDEESRTSGASTAASNAGRGTDDARRDDQENADVSNGERGIGDDASSDLRTGFATPRGKTPRDGSPAPPRV